MSRKVIFFLLESAYYFKSDDEINVFFARETLLASVDEHNANLKTQ